MHTFIDPLDVPMVAPSFSGSAVKATTASDLGLNCHNSDGISRLKRQQQYTAQTQAVHTSTTNSKATSTGSSILNRYVLKHRLAARRSH